MVERRMTREPGVGEPHWGIADESLAREREEETGPHGKAYWEARLPVVFFLAAVVLIPSLVVAFWGPGGSPRGDVAALVAWTTRDVVLLLGVGALYLNWRLTSSATIGWYTAALLAATLHLLTFDLLALAERNEASVWAAGQNPDAAVLLPLPVLLLLGVRNRPVPTRTGPLAIGLAVAIGTGALRLAHLSLGDASPLLHQDPPWVLYIVMIVLGGTSCLVMTRASALPTWARHATAASGSLLILTHIASAMVPAGGIQTALAMVGTASAVGATASALNLCVGSVRAVEESHRLLDARVIEAEERVLRNSEVLHELRATLAGVNKAASLLRGRDSVLPTGHRARLQEMVDTELSRMERLLDSRRPGTREPVDLDDLIEPLVLARRTLGFEVDWEPSGIQALGSADDIVEAIHILLTNAGRHAPDGPASVVVAPDAAGTVAVRVSDSGPGVDDHVMAHLFEREVRGRRSPGQGIGLYIARRLVRQQGGDLLLESSKKGEGSTFLLLLPTVTQGEFS